jgi:hypothetical protein
LGWLLDSRSDMPFVRLFPFDIIEPQSSDATFYSRGLDFLPDMIGERWPSRLVVTAAKKRLSFRRDSHTPWVEISTQRCAGSCLQSGRGRRLLV